MAERSGVDTVTRSETDLVIVTGVSGGGRSTVARALENVGFYVVSRGRWRTSASTLSTTFRRR